MFKRVLVIVLDGVGVGALPDADLYGDQGTATLQHVAKQAGTLSLPNLQQLGLGRIVPIEGVEAVTDPSACWGRMAERSAGKDSVSGHWELAGVVLDQPFATFPNGFPDEIIAAFSEQSGYSPLGNIAASGTDILRSLGEEHLRTGRPIVYTSSDSVFQIAAHEDVIAPERLYAICRIAEKVLEPWSLCRVIARPFRGNSADDFYRTGGRHDFTRKPPSTTLLDLLQGRGIATCAVGKIYDLYGGRGFSHREAATGNVDVMAKTLRALKQINHGLVMANLVDFDMLYGHRRDAAGFASALQQFDSRLPELAAAMEKTDLLIISADHGCDPTAKGTDHTREYVPLLAFHKNSLKGKELGTRSSFADIGATIADNFQLKLANGQSFLADLLNQ